MLKKIVALLLFSMASFVSAEELCAIENATAYATNPTGANARPSSLMIEIGKRYTLVQRANGWLRLQSGPESGWARAGAFGSCASAPYPAARAGKQESKSNGVARSTQAKPQESRRSYESGSGCPCGGGKVCVGPRGGRYCITSGGNKKYGV